MNERIKELAIQVGAGTPQSLYGRTDYIVMTEFELQKFAELIVRECEQVSLKSSHRDDDMGAIIAKQIREHFGVK